MKEQIVANPAQQENPKTQAEKPNFGWQQRNQVSSRVYSDDMLVPDSMPHKTGLSAVYLLFGGLAMFIIWASFFELDQAVRAQGNIIPSARTQIIQVADGGILEQLLVQEGDKVKLGQALAVMEDQRAKATFEESRAKVKTLEAGLIRSTAQGQGKTPNFDRLMPEFADLVRVQQRLYEQQRKSLDDGLYTLEQGLSLADEEHKMNLALAETDDISRLDVMRSQREVQDLNGKLSQLKNDYAKQARKEASEFQNQLAVARYKQAERQNLLDHTVLTAPVDGVVKYLKVSTIGGVLKAGDELMQISPTNGKLLIEVKLKPMDVGQIELGLPVTIKLDAFDYAIYGSLDGVLTYVSSDTLTEQVGGQAQTYYRAQVGLAEDALENNTKISGRDLKQGMTATVDIKTGRRSVLQFIAKPIMRAFAGALLEK
jgi:adhesin transport system membrane fusion protein